MTTAQIIDYLIKFLGLLGASGMVVFLITRKINKSDQKREAREQARMQAELLSSNGLCAVGDLAEATALAQKNGRTNGETTTALDTYRRWRKIRDAFYEKQAIENLRKEA